MSFGISAQIWDFHPNLRRVGFKAHPQEGLLSQERTGIPPEGSRLRRFCRNESSSWPWGPPAHFKPTVRGICAGRGCYRRRRVVTCQLIRRPSSLARRVRVLILLGGGFLPPTPLRPWTPKLLTESFNRTLRFFVCFKQTPPWVLQTPCENAQLGATVSSPEVRIPKIILDSYAWQGPVEAKIGVDLCILVFGWPLS